MCYKVSKSQQKVFFINHLFLFLWQATPLRSAPLRSPPKLYFSNERGTTTLLRQRSNFNLRVEMRCPSSTIEAPFSASLAPTSDEPIYRFNPQIIIVVVDADEVWDQLAELLQFRSNPI